MASPVVEFECSLEAAARDFNAKAFVEGSADLKVLKGRLGERGLSPEDAQSLCERLVRALVMHVAEDIGTPYRETLSRLISVQRRVMRLYDTARQSTHLPPSFLTDMPELLRLKEQYFEELRRLNHEHPTDALDRPTTSLDSLIGHPTDETPVLPDEAYEGPGTTSVTDESPRAPRVTAKVRADVAENVAELRRRAGIPSEIELGAGKMKGTASSKGEQHEGFRGQDPLFAARGMEATFKFQTEPRVISVDGVLWTGGRRVVTRGGAQVEVETFRLGEFKAADPSEGAQSIYTDLDVGTDIEGGFRDQLERLMNLCDRIDACDGITYRTNTAQSADALTMLIDSIHPRGTRESGRIRVEGPIE